VNLILFYIGIQEANELLRVLSANRIYTAEEIGMFEERAMQFGEHYVKWFVRGGRKRRTVFPYLHLLVAHMPHFLAFAASLGRSLVDFSSHNSEHSNKFFKKAHTSGGGGVSTTTNPNSRNTHLQAMKQHAIRTDRSVQQRTPARHQRQHKCGRCGRLGHNRATCTEDRDINNNSIGKKPFDAKEFD
jgi:hypothetical protein